MNWVDITELPQENEVVLVDFGANYAIAYHTRRDSHSYNEETDKWDIPSVMIEWYIVNSFDYEHTGDYRLFDYNYEIKRWCRILK